MSGYDPATNPRHLAPVVEDPDYEEQRSQMEARMQQIIDACSAQIAMFESRGWAFLTAYMKQELDDAVKALRTPSPNQSMEDVQLIRGQIMAWETLINVPTVVRNQRDYYIEQSKQYRNTQ